MSEYFEKYKDPRWQKKRLEILERDGFKCVMCGDNEDTLHVHHTYYEWNKDPWDYPKEAFITVCVSCHELETFYKKEFTVLFRQLITSGYTYSDLYQLIALLQLPSEFSCSDRVRYASLVSGYDPLMEYIKLRLQPTDSSEF